MHAVFVFAAFLNLCFALQPNRIRNFQLSSGNALDEGSNSIGLTDGDIVSVKLQGHQIWCVCMAAHDNSLLLHPLNSKLPYNDLELTLDEEMEPFPTCNCEIMEVIHDDDIDFQQRIVEDRTLNPHGEEAEDIWIIYDYRNNENRPL